MRTLWTFGCSFTAPYYPIDNPDLQSNYDLYKKWRGGNLPKIWPTLLSEKIGYNLINRGVGGSSNYLILNQFLEVASEIKKEDILIFGWTQMSRFQLVNMEENVFNQILPAVNYFPGVDVDINSINQIFVNRTNPIWNEELIKWIYFFNLFTNNIGAHIFHWTSDVNTTKYLMEKYSWDHRFILPKKVKFNEDLDLLGEIGNLVNTEDKLIAKIIEETNGEVNDGHFGEFGHKSQCEHFYNYISNFIEFKKLI